jgi:hypothetical protein
VRRSNSTPFSLQSERAIADQDVRDRRDDQEHRIFPAAIGVAEDEPVRQVHPRRHRQHRQQHDRDVAGIDAGQDERSAHQLQCDHRPGHEARQAEAVQPAGETGDAEGGDLEPGVADPHGAQRGAQQGCAGARGCGFGGHDGSLQNNAVASI